MSENKSTILIPDISGYTEFMTTTELTHASHAINHLIDAMLEAVGDKFEVSEIEGDAVLLVRKGVPPSRKELVDTCLSIFNAFHFRRKFMQQRTICPCGACQAIINLTLKFVVHYGPLAEMKVGRFIKQSGTDMIVAHRLLKNSIDSSEYLLITEKLLLEVQDSSQYDEREWVRASDKYNSIGEVNYQFMSLNEAKKRVPDPEPVENDYASDDIAYAGFDINAYYMDVYMALTDIPERPTWMSELHSVEQEGTDVYIGSVHYCKFDGQTTTISPLRMTISEDGVIYAERCEVKELNLNVINEFAIRSKGGDQCKLTVRFINSGETEISDETRQLLMTKIRIMGESLKSHCESTAKFPSEALRNS